RTGSSDKVLDMGLRDHVAKLEKDKKRREKVRVDKVRAKLAPREELARTIHDALAEEADYLAEENFDLAHDTHSVRLDHALGYILILCEDERANICLFLREQEGSREVHPHKSANVFTKTVPEAVEAVAARISIMRDVVAERGG
ncbi:MAG: hypothetical protein ACR2PF_11475, partial [Rhizobiaceae bacterium]